MSKNQVNNVATTHASTTRMSAAQIARMFTQGGDKSTGIAPHSAKFRALQVAQLREQQKATTDKNMKAFYQAMIREYETPKERVWRSLKEFVIKLFTPIDERV